MPKGVSDDRKLPLTCPGCAKRFEQTVGRLKADKKVLCPGRRQSIEIESVAVVEQVDKRIDEARNIDEARKALDEIGKR